MKRVEINDVRIKDPIWQKKAKLNAQFLDEMDPERVLAGFYRSSGIRTEAEPYGGWENSLIAGHGVGHFFSALAMRIAVLRGEILDAEVKDLPAGHLQEALAHSLSQAQTIVCGLKKCQEETGSGFLSAATVQDPKRPQIQFDALEGLAEVQTWVPWYALHKVLQGLLDLWRYAEIPSAREVTISLADWVCERVGTWSKETRSRVLAVEYGGMNDSLYQIYMLTGQKKYFSAAQIFDEPELYEDLLSFTNRLRGVHANATIPKIVGYLQGAAALCTSATIATEDEKKRIAIAERFWKTVVDRQSYATGGIGDMEHFFEDGKTDASRTQCNAESCCTYNMMKLSQMLYELTGKVCYLEYIERALWNAKLGSVGPCGGYTYFNPMATGYYRLYSPNHPAENPFWCCVGTGLEDFVKFGDQVFYHNEDSIVIAQWLSSEMTMPDGTKLALVVDHFAGNLTLTCRKAKDKASVDLRIPRWIKAREKLLPEDQDLLHLTLSEGERYDLSFEMELSVIRLQDESSAMGFMYGPFVLCVPLGKEKWGLSTGAGIEVYAPSWKVVFDAAVKSDISYGRTQKSILDREYLMLPSCETVESFPFHLSSYLKKTGSCEFHLTGVRNGKGETVDLPLVPYYSTGDERYGIYWYFVQEK
ncbi:MAG: glycoside hydrolase family 127 protein [Clostridiales bacterium]|nr:glycoside hydrolase family 127 protein [Clostridiales bacterium]